MGLKKCVICNNDFEPLTIKSRFCSKKCKTKYENIQRTSRIRARRIIINKTCIVCDKEFVPHVRNPHQIYCSKDCCIKAVNENKLRNGKYKEYYQNNKEKNRSRKKEIMKDYYDRKAYGGNRGKVLERDEHKCTKCGIEEESLHIHHIDESGQTENPNNDMDNLITLCGSCHSRLHILVDNPKYKHIPKEKILALRKACSTWLEVSQKLGVSYRTILRNRKKYGIN